jgi:hypothetical protein
MDRKSRQRPERLHALRGPRINPTRSSTKPSPDALYRASEAWESNRAGGARHLWRPAGSRGPERNIEVPILGPTFEHLEHLLAFAKRGDPQVHIGKALT